MMDDYYKASPDSSKNSSRKISIMKHSSEAAQQDIQDTLSDAENTAIVDLPEKPKKLNFQPIQEPSFKWHETPKRDKNENARKAFTMRVSPTQLDTDTLPESHDHIEERLNNLLEETRRKMLSYDNDDSS